MTPFPQFITYPAIAEMVGVKVKSVHRWRLRHKATFPEAQVCPCCGHHPVLDREAILEWLLATNRRTR